MDNIMSKKQDSIGTMYVLGATILWGSSYIFQKLLLESNVQPFMMVGLRFSFALVILFKIKFKDLSKSTWLKGVVMGIVLFSAFSFQTIGLQYIDVSTSAFLTGLTVIVVPILNYLFFKTGLTIVNFFVTGLAIVGVYLFNITPNNEFEWNIGILLTLLCAISFGIHIILSDCFLKKEDPITLNGIQSIVCAILGYIFSFSIGEVFPMNWSPQAIIGILYLGLVGSVACYTLQAMGQKLIINVIKVGLILAMEPIFATILSVVFQGEILTLYKISGMLIIMGCLVISELQSVLFQKKYKYINTKTIKKAIIMIAFFMEYYM